MTEFVFRSQSYLQTLPASVTEMTADGGIGLDRTIFYAASGGQPNDTGRIVAADSRVVPIVSVVHPEGDKTRLTLVHTRLRGAEDARNFGGGWLSHLAVLEARLAGRPVPDFWAIHTEKEAEAAAALG